MHAVAHSGHGLQGSHRNLIIKFRDFSMTIYAIMILNLKHIPIHCSRPIDMELSELLMRDS